jgi:hypothetical protein
VNRKTLNTILIILGILGGVLLIYFISGNKKSFSWHESYQTSSTQPYGLSFIKQLLQGTQDGKFSVREKGTLSKMLEDHDFKKDTKYVFVGESLYLSTDDQLALLNSVYEGNTAFLATREIPDFISDAYNAECALNVSLNENRLITVSMNFYHESFRQKYGYSYAYRFQNKDLMYNWGYFSEDLFCDSTRALTPIGFVEPDKVNFVRLPYGKGYIYMHSNPLVFTNYFMIQKQKMEYASAVFSHIEAKNTIWEEFGKVPLMGGNDNELDNPLYYIMQQPSLKYAWWLIVLTALLYIFFAAKRTQRVIPVLESKTNTSLEFVRMIAALHFENRDHIGMARKKMKYFYFFIRSKYGIHGHPYSEEMTQKLAEKSKVPLEDVKAVFKFYKLIDEGSNGNIDGPRLSNFYKTVENFYKQCK